MPMPSGPGRGAQPSCAPTRIGTVVGLAAAAAAAAVLRGLLGVVLLALLGVVLLGLLAMVLRGLLTVVLLGLLTIVLRWLLAIVLRGLLGVVLPVGARQEALVQAVNVVGSVAIYSQGLESPGLG